MMPDEEIRDDDEFWLNGAVAYQIIARKASRCHLTLMEMANYIDSLSDWDIMAGVEEIREEE